jgi:Smg protein
MNWVDTIECDMANESTSVLNVLMFLFHHHMEGNCHIPESQRPVVRNKLENAGFMPEQINGAFNWLSSLKHTHKSLSHMPRQHTLSTRVYTRDEIRILNTECIDYLHQLQKLGILNAQTIEAVIDLALQLDTEGVDISLVKWVTLMTLYNEKEYEQELSKMELLVLSDATTTLH